MSPRPYNLGQRRAAANETRTRIVEAARELLADESYSGELSMQAIARKADVSRLTIYYQFGSRPGLLDALYDYMAARGNVRQVAETFQEADPNKALEKMIKAFMQFWASDPVAIHRLRAMAALDAEINRGVQARDARRRNAAEEIVQRLRRQQPGPKTGQEQSFTADVLATLTSFEMYDHLKQAGHGDGAITAVVLKLATTA